jgi:hypothetical protein
LDELCHPDAPPSVRDWANTPPEWLKIHPDPQEPDQTLAALDPGERTALRLKQSNEAYVNSHVNHRLRLLSIEAVDYTEASIAGGGIGTDIVRLMNKTDGNLDSVHNLRDARLRHEQEGSN